VFREESRSADLAAYSAYNDVVSRVRRLGKQAPTLTARAALVNLRWNQDARQ
jgi:hypothetical protein